MARYDIGKLKLNFSRQGIAFKMGDGRVHRLPFPGGSQPEEDEYEGETGYREDEDYDRYEDEEDNYGRRASYDDADDAYDRRASRSRYAEYDDDYGDEGEAEEPYEDDYAEDEGASGSVMQYIEENDWVTLALLVILPPVGIYMLWRRQCYDRPIRIGMSIASMVWFFVLLFLLIPRVFGSGSDTTATQTGTVTLTTVAPTAAVQAAAVPVVTPDNSQLTAATVIPIATVASPANEIEVVDPMASPSATPLPGGSASDEEYVYSPSTGLYYHANETCADIPAGVTTQRVPLDLAVSRGQSACPTCYGGTLYYASENGTHYHIDPTCSNMVNPVTITKEAAEQQGKTACPVCMAANNTGTATVTAPDTIPITGSTYNGILLGLTTDKSGKTVWCTPGGTNYHTKSNCRGMSGASNVSLLNAIQAGKTACPTCCASAATKVWCTKNGTYYHNKSNCSGMTSASQVTYAEALVLGKDRCPVCLGAAASNTGTGTAAGGTSSEVYVYATPNGKYYHTKSNCSGMTNAARVTLQSMLSAGRPACPTCCGNAGQTVYANSGGKYYHSKPSCRDMASAPAMTLAQALASGKVKCPYCWGDGSTSIGTKTAVAAASANAVSASKAAAAPTAAIPEAPAVNNAAGETAAERTSAAKTTTVTTTSASGNTGGAYVYATANGRYYHTNSTCGGMTNARRVPLSAMLSSGRSACPTCAAGASKTVYASRGDSYYHYNKTHAGAGAASGTLAEALAYGLKACPACVNGSGKAAATATRKPTTAAKAYTYKAGASGVKVYATVSNRYYHTKSNCSGLSGAAYVSLETALNAGKTACPVCASAGSRTVYARNGDSYYHYNKTHAGCGAKTGTIAEALAYGLKACPTCVSGSGSGSAQKSASAGSKARSGSSNTYASGTSGLSVYATKNGKYYHTKSNCSGQTGALKVSLETALNYGKTACPVCASSASKTVYARKGDAYYHYSQLHAGSGAKSGPIAKAVAYGLKPCPECSGGKSSAGGSGGSKATPKPTVKPTATPKPTA